MQGGDLRCKAKAKGKGQRQSPIAKAKTRKRRAARPHTSVPLRDRSRSGVQINPVWSTFVPVESDPSRRRSLQRCVVSGCIIGFLAAELEAELEAEAEAEAAHLRAQGGEPQRRAQTSDLRPQEAPGTRPARDAEERRHGHAESPPRAAGGASPAAAGCPAATPPPPRTERCVVCARPHSRDAGARRSC